MLAPATTRPCELRGALGFDLGRLGGRHAGSGGGNHIALGGATVADSPLLRRPDLLSAEAQLRAADANVAAARAAFFPSIDLSGGLTAGLTGGASVLGSLAASLSAPIFSAGRLEGGLEGARARVDQQIARYRQTTLNALRDVDVVVHAERLLDHHDAALRRAGRIGPVGAELVGVGIKAAVFEGGS